MIFYSYGKLQFTIKSIAQYSSFFLDAQNKDEIRTQNLINISILNLGKVRSLLSLSQAIIR